VFRPVFASLITFGLLIGMVAGVVLAAMVSTGEVNFGVAIVLTIAVNLFIWLISPWLSDLTLRRFNDGFWKGLWLAAWTTMRERDQSRPAIGSLRGYADR